MTPDRLDRLLRALQRWRCEVISLDDACARLTQGTRGRFACLTFDGAYKDVMTFAYPVLARHRVPFAVFIPTAFPDALGEAWWLALEQVVARTDRIAMMMDGNERRFATATVGDKLQAYDYLAAWLRALPPADLTAAISDLCKRYSVDLAVVSTAASMDWDDIAKLAADPLVAIGSATVNYPVLARLDDTAAQREINMGRAVTRAAIGRDVAHFAYPFGDRDTLGPRHVEMAGQAGFTSALTSIPGSVGRNAAELHALPRIAWDGRHSLRALRVMLSGFMPGATGVR